MKAQTVSAVLAVLALLVNPTGPQQDEETNQSAPPAATSTEEMDAKILAERFREAVNSSHEIQIKMTEDVIYYEMGLEDGEFGERDARVASQQALAAGEKGTYISIRIVSFISTTPRSLESKVYRPDISDEPVSVICIKADEDTGRPVGSVENLLNGSTSQSNRITWQSGSFPLSDFYDEEWIDQAENVLGNPALVGLPAACGANAEAWVIWQNGEADSIAKVIASRGQLLDSVTDPSGRKLYRAYCLFYDDVEEDAEEGHHGVSFGANTYFLDAETGLMVGKENFRIHNRKGKYQSGLLTTRTYEWDIRE